MRSLSAMLRLLVERAGPNLTAADLDQLDGGCEMAGLLMNNLSAFTNGAAALVASDEQSGGLQGQEAIADTLFLVASIADLAYGLGEMERIWLDRVQASVAGQERATA